MNASTMIRWLMFAACIGLICLRPDDARALDDGLAIESADERFGVRVGGRVHADYAHVDSDRESGDRSGSEWRRARLFIAGRLFRDVRFRYEHDFTSDQNAQIKDAYIGYHGFERMRLRVGNLVQPVSLEQMTGSNATVFMERALPNALVRGYSLGVLGETWREAAGADWYAAAGVFEGRVQGREHGESQGWALAGRVAWSAQLDRGSRLHVGLSAEHRTPPGDDRVRFGALPEVHLSTRRLLSTGTLSDVDRTVTAGLELALTHGPLLLQGEYLQTSVARHGRENVRFQGGYVLAAWLINGTRRGYNPRSATFDPIRASGRWGTWEVAARYSVLDLQDGPITGGEERNWTLGLNVHVNDHLRLMANWVEAEAVPASSGRDARLSALQARVQIQF